MTLGMFLLAFLLLIKNLSSTDGLKKNGLLGDDVTSMGIQYFVLSRVFEKYANFKP